MLLVDSLAEEHIRAASRRGEFDELPGQGQPLNLEDDSAVPAELRVGYRILKNSGCLPPELTLRKEIGAVESLLDLAELGAEQKAIRRRLCLLQARLAMHGHEGNLLLREQAYRDKMIAKIARNDEKNCRPNLAETSIAEAQVT